MAALDVIFVCFLGLVCHAIAQNDDVPNTKNFVYWPNATVPFYINPDHFDHEQAISIMTSLSSFAFKSCVKFLPVMAAPRDADHVLVLQNPGALRQCRWTTGGHSIEEPHIVNLGYQCLQSPHIEMTIMKALGFPFEHNRASRDLFIDVQYENIEPDSVELFTKDSRLPVQLRNLPYDVNSAMHFGERDFSKNGHRTIIIKDRNVKQNRVGLSSIDLRKIEIVYGPECQKRDRQEKIDLCQVYPGVVRKKRELNVEENENLRVNRDIYPPQNKNLTEDVVDMLKNLGIVKEIEDIVDTVYKIASIAVENAKHKYCNVSKVLRNSDSITINGTTTHPSVQTIVEAIAKFSQSFVDIAVANLTVFCDTAEAIETYQRVCNNMRDPRCRSYYKSTKSGPVIHYTQHRPVYFQSTKHDGSGRKPQYGRSGNSTDKNETIATARSKRDAHKESTEDEMSVIGVSSNRTTSLTDKKEINDDRNVLNLRSVTSVIHKREHYAPFRRSERYRVYSRKYKDKESLSSSQESDHRRTEGLNSKQISDSESDTPKPKIRPLPPKRYKKRPVKRIPDVPQTVPLTKENKEFYADRKWPRGVIRYIVTDYEEYDLDDLRSRIRQVNDILRSRTCVRLEELRATDANKFSDYLVLDTSPDYVTGRVGGRQVFGSLELFKGVSHLQHTAMMVMAWLGFYFEVSRHDRDEHVVVHNRHIRPDKLHHFERLRPDATLAVPYDYKSATHPSWQFWRKIGKTGISVVATHKDQDPDGSIMRSFGQNPELLSDLDIVRINSVYGVQCFKRGLRNKTYKKANQ